MSNELSKEVLTAETFQRWLVAFFKANGITDQAEINSIQVIVSSTISSNASIIKQALESWLAGKIEYKGRLTARAIISIIKEHERLLEEDRAEQNRIKREQKLATQHEVRAAQERIDHDKMVAKQIEEQGSQIEKWQDVPQHIWFDYCTRQGYWKRLSADDQQAINDLGEQLADQNEQPESKFILYPHRLQDTKRKLAIWIHVLNNELPKI